jgi:hypothetical protein
VGDISAQVTLNIGGMGSCSRVLTGTCWAKKEVLINEVKLQEFII